uniref:Uncharacterized protein n=1 Tax=Trichogramma kaykai TaxID=54128 RepID=A0ABD2WAP6_9HYME
MVLSYSNIYSTQYSSFITVQFCFFICCSLRPNLIGQFTFSTVVFNDATNIIIIHMIRQFRFILTAYFCVIRYNF